MPSYVCWSGGPESLSNALFAVAIGHELGLDRSQIQNHLIQCLPGSGRMQFLEVSGVRVLDDSYNANPDSMLAVLETLHELNATAGALLWSETWRSWDTTAWKRTKKWKMRGQRGISICSGANSMDYRSGGASGWAGSRSRIS